MEHLLPSSRLVHLSLSISLYKYIHLSIYLTIYLSIYLSIYLYIFQARPHLCVCARVCVCTTLFPG